MNPFPHGRVSGTFSQNYNLESTRLEGKLNFDEGNLIVSLFCIPVNVFPFEHNILISINMLEWTLNYLVSYNKEVPQWNILAYSSNLVQVFHVLWILIHFLDSIIHSSQNIKLDKSRRALNKMNECNDNHIPACMFDNKFMWWQIHSPVCCPSYSRWKYIGHWDVGDTCQSFNNISKVYFLSVERLAHGSLPLVS